MKTIETVGKDIEQALKNGLAELGCKIDDVDVKILEHPGIFRKARVRLTYTKADEHRIKTAAGVMRNLEERAAKSTSQAKNWRERKNERDALKASVKGQRGEEKAKQPEQKTQPTTAKPVQQKVNNQPKSEQPKTEKKVEQPKQPVQAKPEFRKDFRADLLKAQSTGAPLQSKAEQPKTEKKVEEPKAEQPKTEKKTEQPKAEQQAKSLPTAQEVAEAREKAVAYLRGIAPLIGETSALTSETTDSEVFFKFVEESETLVANKGEALDALEYLVNATVGGNVKINVDSGSFRARRDEALVRLANEKAGVAVQTGKRVQLPPMNSASRKTVHAVLSERGDVITRSEGKEPNRYIVIMPKQGGKNGGKANYKHNKKFKNKKKSVGVSGEKA